VLELSKQDFETVHGGYLYRKDYPSEMGVLQIEGFAMEREAIETFPIPGLYLKTGHLATDKVVTTAALWRSLRRGK
jgi:hypothetical protein